MYVGSHAYEYRKKLFCTLKCALEFADNYVTDGVVEESDCEGDAE